MTSQQGIKWMSHIYIYFLFLGTVFRSLAFMIRFNAENLPLICLLTLCSAVEILLKGINMKMLAQSQLGIQLH